MCFSKNYENNGYRMSVNINVFSHAEMAASQLAAAIASDLHAALAEKPRALLLVSGGKSPVPLFTALANEAVDWRRVDISLVDERAVAPEAQQANAALVRAELMSGPAHAACWIPLMPEEIWKTSGHAWQAIERAAELANADTALMTPAVVVLGIGTDGHTASLFPDAPEWPNAAITSARYVCLQPPEAPYARLSLSLQALRNQRRCYMWAVGSGKTATLAKLQQTASNTIDINILHRAGPVACLMADPAVQLEVYCCDID